MTNDLLYHDILLLVLQTGLQLSKVDDLILLILWHFIAIVANVSLVVYRLWHPC